MIPDTFLIAGSAASVGFIHTILGPDHYLPLVAMAKTNGWSGPKIASYTAFCGFSHVLGTILIGSLVFLLGLAFFNIETVQSVRGDFAGWFLLLFGAIYLVWGVRWVIRKKQLKQDSEEVEAQPSTFSRCTPFALFIFFILGPCEPLIPLMSLGTENTEIFSSYIGNFCVLRDYGTDNAFLCDAFLLWDLPLFFFYKAGRLHACCHRTDHFLVWISNPISWCLRLVFVIRIWLWKFGLHSFLPNN